MKGMDWLECWEEKTKRFKEARADIFFLFCYCKFKTNLGSERRGKSKQNKKEKKRKEQEHLELKISNSPGLDMKRPLISREKYPCLAKRP